MRYSDILLYALPVLLIINISMVIALWYTQKELEQSLYECLSIKQEYQDTLLLCKRNVWGHFVQDADETQRVSKKKMIQLIRNGKTLANQALDFAEKQQMRDLIAPLYQEMGNDILSTGTGKKQKIKGRSISKKVTKRKRRSVSNGSTELAPKEKDPRVMHARASHNFVWPLERSSCWMTQGFGPRRHPKGHWEFHSGIDLAAPLGTPVYAAADGKIKQAEYAGGYGNMVLIAHDTHCLTRYAHLSKILVHVGQRVTQGSCIGLVGATGNVRGKNGIHLHFEVMLHNKRINPCYVLP